MIFTPKANINTMEWENMFGGEGVVTTNDFFAAEDISPDIRVWGTTILPPNAIVGNHHHIDEQEMIYVIEGNGVSQSEDDCIILNKGDAILTGPNESHKIIAGPQGLTIFVTIISTKKEK